MKQTLKLYLLAAGLMLGGAAMLTSCSDDDNNSTTTYGFDLSSDFTPAAQKDFTIIFYGAGGANLDNSILENILQAYEGTPASYQKVNFVGQFKFSTAANLKKDMGSYYGLTDEMCANVGGKTFRFIANEKMLAGVDTTGFDKRYKRAMISRTDFYGKDNADVANPDSLANFIRWAAKVRPASHYLLILSDHGGGYMPQDDLPAAATTKSTRGILYDDGNKENGNDKHFTVSTVRDAIKQSGVKLQTIYFDACLMNTVEYQFELKDLADYLVLSTFLVPGEGGSFDILIDQLAQNGANIETALTNYNKGAVGYWDKRYAQNKVNYHDMTVTRTSGLDAFGQQWKAFTDRLCDAYQNGGAAVKDSIDECTLGAFKIENSRPEFDLTTYAKSIMDAVPAYFDEGFAKQLATAFNNCIVSQQSSKYLEDHGWSIDCSILLGTKGHWTYHFWKEDEQRNPIGYDGCYVYYADGTMQEFDVNDNKKGNPGTWGSTLADTYMQLAFDKATEWHRWIQLNEVEPLSASPANFKLDIFD